MISYKEVRELNRKATHKAIQENLKPKEFEHTDINMLKGGLYDNVFKDIPVLGTHLPEDWTRVDLEALGERDTHGVYSGDNEGYGALFVDATGIGKDWEPAITFERLAQFVIRNTEYGYGIVERGEFQVKIGLFELLTGQKTLF